MFAPPPREQDLVALIWRYFHSLSTLMTMLSNLQNNLRLAVNSFSASFMKRFVLAVIKVLSNTHNADDALSILFVPTVAS
jgi:hypothetical protein